MRRRTGCIRLVLLAGGISAGILLVALGIFWVTLPDVARLRKENPPTTAFIERRKAELRRRGRPERVDRTWVPLASISPHLVQAVGASEDEWFWHHRGFDFGAMQRAAREGWKDRNEPPKKRRRLRGGSTITQQLAKNLYLSPERSLWRKVREAAITEELERQLSKERILEIYLNSIEWGDRTWGAEAAARRYFRKPAARLSREEAAFLAAMIPGPTRALNPALHPGRVARRQRIILRLMRTGSGLPWKRPAVREDPVEDDEETAPAPSRSPAA